LALGPHGYLAYHLRRRLGVASVWPVVAACASGLTALHLARLALLAPGGPRRVLVVSSEAAILPLFIRSYRRLGVLPPLTPQGYRTRPLDRRRCGFVLAEQAAAILLERDDAGAGDPPGAGPLGAIELLDTAAFCEGYDLVRPAPGMPALRHLAARILAPLVQGAGHGAGAAVLHPHATGTFDNDAAELAAYAHVLGSAAGAVDVYACKGALGHSLGTAGLTALVLACLCGRTRRRPPMPWLEDPLATPLPLRAAAGVLPPASTHAVFAAGFGGHVAGAVVHVHDSTVSDLP
jgi:3-oxoacyl-[acyl-carrier-protein] synthase II